MRLFRKYVLRSLPPSADLDDDIEDMLMLAPFVLAEMEGSRAPKRATMRLCLPMTPVKPMYPPTNINPYGNASAPPQRRTHPSMDLHPNMSPSAYGTELHDSLNHGTMPAHPNMSPSFYAAPPPHPQQSGRQKQRAGRGSGKGRATNARPTRYPINPTISSNPYGNATAPPGCIPPQVNDAAKQYQHMYSSFAGCSQDQEPPTIDLDADTPQMDAHCFYNPSGYYVPGGSSAQSNDESEYSDRSGGGRQGNYTEEEDIALCSAFLFVCKDPIVGANQTSKAYWDRVVEQFHTGRNYQYQRPRSSLQKRWEDIQNKTYKFCSCKAQVDRLARSGKTEHDRIEEAKTLFLEDEGEQFKFMHCWYILRDQRKWLDHCEEKKTRAAAKAAQGPNDSPGLEALIAGDDDLEARPIGRDSAKKRRSAEAEAVTSSAASANIEVMQNLVVSKKKQVDTEAAWAGDYSSREERELLLEERKREDDIMSMDLQSLSLSEWQRTYWEAEQKRIARRRAREAAAEDEEAPPEVN